MPTIVHSRCSSRAIVAVRPITGMALTRSSSLARIARVSSKPSITGMWQSVSTRSKSSFSSAASAS
ncbi:hypothetical protein D9M68_886700 [compost metagenome]